MRKGNVVKHSVTDLHVKTVNLTKKKKGMMFTDKYKSTPLGKAMAGAYRACMKKLFEISYTVAYEELPFTKYPVLIDLELLWGQLTQHLTNAVSLHQ